MQDLVVRDQRESSVVFVVCGLSTQYYQIMSGAEGMPVLVDE
ncbi:MAG: hypothetical protein JWO38_7058 [Gemmataceae bacterium]|nr:hypothetical protein [Gemmataceae bacterium]